VTGLVDLALRDDEEHALLVHRGQLRGAQHELEDRLEQQVLHLQGDLELVLGLALVDLGVDDDVEAAEVAEEADGLLERRVGEVDAHAHAVELVDDLRLARIDGLGAALLGQRRQGRHARIHAVSIVFIVPLIIRRPSPISTALVADRGRGKRIRNKKAAAGVPEAAPRLGF
jgi:hypothetical protein